MAVLLLAQAIFAPLDIHFFEGDALDCEWFLDYNPYESEPEGGIEIPQEMYETAQDE